MAGSANSFSPSLCPCWYAPTPKQFRSSQQIDENWYNLSLKVRDENHFPKTFDFTIEKSTGDLYGIQSYTEDRFVIAQKCTQIFFVAPIYTAGVILSTFVRGAIGVGILCARFFAEMEARGAVAGFLGTTWNISNLIVVELGRCIKAPFYAVAIMCAALWGVFQPYEGRKRIAELEFEWHERASYKMDVRHAGPKGSHAKCKRITKWLIKNTPSEVAKGKFFFLAYCFQKRGNINETLTSKIQKFERIMG